MESCILFDDRLARSWCYLGLCVVSAVLAVMDSDGVAYFAGLDRKRSKSDGLIECFEKRREDNGGSTAQQSEL
jgi:hypothetical protein